MKLSSVVLAGAVALALTPRLAQGAEAAPIPTAQVYLTGVHVTDLERAVSFYRAIGLKEVRRYGDGVRSAEVLFNDTGEAGKPGVLVLVWNAARKAEWSPVLPRWWAVPAHALSAAIAAIVLVPALRLFTARSR